MNACLCGNFNVVKIILKYAPEVVEQENELNESGFILACKNNFIEIAIFLVEKEPKVIS